MLKSWQRWLLNAAALLTAAVLLTIWRGIDQELGIRHGWVLTAGCYLLIFVGLKWLFGWTKRRWQAHESAIAASDRTGTNQANSTRRIQSAKSRPGRLPGSIPLAISIATAAVLVAAFYWYEYRPAQIRTECERLAVAQAQGMMQQRAAMSPRDANLQSAVARGLYYVPDKDNSYVSCLRSRGLKGG